MNGWRGVEEDAGGQFARQAEAQVALPNAPNAPEGAEKQASQASANGNDGSHANGV
jgi:hypothetical protein